MRAIAGLGTLLVGLALAACTESPQVASSSAKKSDQPAWKGAADPYVAKGWTPGDKDSWQAQIRSRNQIQNEYSRSAPTAAAQ